MKYKVILDTEIMVVQSNKSAEAVIKTLERIHRNVRIACTYNNSEDLAVDLNLDFKSEPKKINNIQAVTAKKSTPKKKA
jgi:UDP-N-acetyl-D-mannosaminuronate dehydrogenase